MCLMNLRHANVRQRLMRSAQNLQCHTTGQSLGSRIGWLSKLVIIYASAVQIIQFYGAVIEDENLLLITEVRTCLPGIDVFSNLHRRPYMVLCHPEYDHSIYGCITFEGQTGCRLCHDSIARSQGLHNLHATADSS